MAFIDDEASAEASQPREGIEIVLPAEVFRIATGTRDVVIDGAKYIATPSARTEFPVPEPGQSSTPQLVLPAAHSFVQRYMRGTVPPRQVTVNVRRLQLRSSTYDVIWRGKIATVHFDGVIARFAIPWSYLSLLASRCPPFVVARSCGNILYDANCQVDRASFKVSTTIANVNGAKVTVSSMSGNPDGWADAGSIVHGPTGERIPIVSQLGAVLELQYPVVGWSNGQAVDVFAGCDKQIATCNDKFSNRPRFIGSPYLNRETLRSPPGYGTYSSE